MSTNGIVILVFFSLWTFVEFQTIFSNPITNIQTISKQAASVLLFLTSTVLWFFRDRLCDGPLNNIENAVLFIVPISPITFLASRFNLPFTATYGINFLCIVVVTELWPVRNERCALPLISISMAILFISMVTSIKSVIPKRI